MLLNQLTSFLLTLLLVDQSDLVNMLIIVVIFFGVLLLLGIRKSYKLKKENERLDAINKKIAEEEDKPYQDFTDGHMYGGN
ncbi:MAG: hypothetical protein WA839_06405 [Flavobacteriaceae bacterium]|tara:strand:+ start:3072 stop:3314 length:243 start_codon:yes stop_codon:yes gene_type:complete